MRSVMMWLGAIAMTICGGSASAITVDGNWSDWFDYSAGNTAANNWDQALAAANTTNSLIRSVADEEGPTPGGGGQDFDIEQIFYHYEDADSNALSGGTLFVGMVTGFPPTGLDPYFAGDLFIGFGAISNLDIGVGVAQFNAGDAGYGGRYGQIYGVSGPGDLLDPDPGPFVVNAPWRVDLANVGTTVTNITGTYAPSSGPVVDWGVDGEHYFMEVAIQLNGFDEDAITDDTNGGLRLHWTMGCGNDVISVTDSTPFVPVPEPTTMVLLGMGVLGMALRARRPVC